MKATEDLRQEGLEEHFKTFYLQQSRDFRAASIAKFVLKLLAPDSNRILDLGCGSCVVTAHLLRQGFDVTSCDNSVAMIEMSRQVLSDEKLPAGQLHQMDASRCAERFPAYFDALICLDVIEHINDDQQALEQIYRCLEPGGSLILSVPAHPSLYGPKDEQVGHYRRYSKSMLHDRLKQAGFQGIRLRYWNMIGYASVWASTRLFDKGIDESFRSSQRSKSQTFINASLRTWLQYVENHIRTPIGLSLFAQATKPH